MRNKLLIDTSILASALFLLLLLFTSSFSDDNIIPQCPFCNQVAGNKWIFDPFGFPKYMTEAGLLSHSPEVLKKFAQTLKERGY